MGGPLLPRCIFSRVSTTAGHILRNWHCTIGSRAIGTASTKCSGSIVPVATSRISYFRTGSRGIRLNRIPHAYMKLSELRQIGTNTLNGPIGFCTLEGAIVFSIRHPDKGVCLWVVNYSLNPSSFDLEDILHGHTGTSNAGTQKVQPRCSNSRHSWILVTAIPTKYRSSEAFRGKG